MDENMSVESEKGKRRKKKNRGCEYHTISMAYYYCPMIRQAVIVPLSVAIFTRIIWARSVWRSVDPQMGGVLQYKTHGQIEKERCPGQPKTNRHSVRGEDNNQMCPLTWWQRSRYAFKMFKTHKYIGFNILPMIENECRSDMKCSYTSSSKNYYWYCMLVDDILLLVYSSIISKMQHVLHML